MAVLGEIIKKAVELADEWINQDPPVLAQQKVLKMLIDEASNTSFGHHYHFSDILRSGNMEEDFRKKVPYFNYEQLREQWWQRVIDGESNITWPGKPRYFAVSSGTTSARKRIPVTERMLEAIQRGGLLQIKGVSDFDLAPEFFEREILMFGSSTNLKEVEGRLEGEISGISTSRIPFWFEGFYRPGKEISSIDDWDERVEALAKEAPNWDIGAISGIPSWIELMLKKVIAYHNVDNIHDIWPNFEVYASGGVAFEPYRKSFEKICGKPIKVIDTYLASEGYIATQMRKDTDAMTLMTDNGIYFEFVPLKPDYLDEDGNVLPDVPSLRLSEVEEGEEYVLIISTVSGAWRYMIGDTITFTNVERAEIKITGRTKHFLNVVGSHLSVMQMNKAVQELEDKYGCDIKEFTAAAVNVNGDYIHRWYLGVDGECNISNEEAGEFLDITLREANKNYNVARNKALKGVEVNTIPARVFSEWTEETKKKGGQVKVPRVMKQHEMEALEGYLRKK